MALDWGCNGTDDFETPPSVPMTLSLAPTLAQVAPGTSGDFDAKLSNVPAGQSNDVAWALSGAGCSGDACGTLFTLSGQSVRYFAPATAPSPAEVRLAAVAEADPTVRAHADILVSAPVVTATTKVSLKKPW